MNDLMTKSFISYVDLKKSALRDLEAGSAAADADFAAGIEMMRTSADENLRRFFLDAESAREDMDSIRALLSRLQEAGEESKSLHRPDPLRRLRARINSDIVLVLRKANSIKSGLEAMDRANAANRRLSGYREGTPIDRTRTSVTNGLRKKLKELMMEFQTLRQRMMAEHREAVERRYFALTGKVAEEEVIERIISNGAGDGEGGILEKAASEHGRGEVAEAVHEIQDRHGAAREVERSLLELHQVFLDMAVMVEVQGEQVDDIEHHVTHAAHYVKDGAKELTTARGHRRSSRKWLCFGIVVLLLLILVVVVPIATSFFTRS